MSNTLAQKTSYVTPVSISSWPQEIAESCKNKNKKEEGVVSFQELDVWQNGLRHNWKEIPGGQKEQEKDLHMFFSPPPPPSCVHIHEKKNGKNWMWVKQALRGDNHNSKTTIDHLKLNYYYYFISLWMKREKILWSWLNKEDEKWWRCRHLGEASWKYYDQSQEITQRLCERLKESSLHIKPDQLKAISVSANVEDLWRPSWVRPTPKVKSGVAIHPARPVTITNSAARLSQKLLQ